MKNQPEFQLQKQIATYLRLQYPKVKFLSDVRASVKLTIPQQVRSKAIQADNFACPDMMIFAVRGKRGGMFLELKASSPYKRNGQLRTDEHLTRQLIAINDLINDGYHADFYWDFTQAKDAIDEYLKV